MHSLILILALLSQANAYRIISRGEISVPKPSFQTLIRYQDPKIPPTLLISSFGVTDPDKVFEIRDMRAPFELGKALVQTRIDSITWPNEVQHLPASEFGTPGDLVCSGFLVPWKSTGAVSFVASNGTVTKLTQDKTGYFYHRAIFADVEGKGRMDLLTARASMPMQGPADGELVWLQRPAVSPLLNHWNEIVLAKGPDVHFRTFREPKSKRLYIFTAEFSKQRLAVYWIEKSGNVGSRVIDDSLGPIFDLRIADLGNDGKFELLVTNHTAEAAKAGLYAYQIPGDVTRGTWSRHTLMNGIATTQQGLQQAAPGAAKVFFPETAKAGKQKPWIVLSGDGSQKAYVLRPKSEDPADWQYDSQIILDAGSTIGEPIAYDFDQDGYTDLVIPAYDSNKLYLFSFLPTPAGKPRLFGPSNVN